MFDWLITYAEQSLLLAVALLALLESLAFVGVLVPGVAMLASLAWLAGQQQQALPLLLLAGFVGAVAGDLLSFLLGRYSAPWIARRKTLQSHPQWLTEGEQFFARYGGISILLGRFVGPLRAVVPFVAGSCGMNSLRFLAFNLLSAALWAPAYLLPGYWLGEQASELDLQWSVWIQLIALTLFIAMLLHAIHHQLEPDRWLSRQMTSFRWFHHQRAGIQLFFFLMAGLALFLLASRLLGWLLPLDRELFAQLQVGIPAFKQAAVVLTLLGDPVHLIGSILITSSLCAIFGYRRLSVHLLLAMAAVGMINTGLKYWVGWPRPEAGLQFYSTYSFPSAHSAGGAILFGALAVLYAMGRAPQQRRYIYWGFLPLVILVALSRVVLGVHWPIDVTAGIAEGLAVAALLRWQFAEPDQDLRLDGRMLGSIAFLQLIFTFSYISLKLPGNLIFYGL